MLATLLSVALAADYTVPYDPDAYDKAMELSDYGGYGYLGGLAATGLGVGLAAASSGYVDLAGGMLLAGVGLSGMMIGGVVMSGGALKARQVLGHGGVEVTAAPGIAALVTFAVPMAAYGMASNYAGITGTVISDEVFLGIGAAATVSIVAMGPLGAVQRTAVRNGHAQLGSVLDLRVVPMVTPEGSGLALGARF